MSASRVGGPRRARRGGAAPRSRSRARARTRPAASRAARRAPRERCGDGPRHPRQRRRRSRPRPLRPRDRPTARSRRPSRARDRAGPANRAPARRPAPARAASASGRPPRPPRRTAGTRSESSQRAPRARAPAFPQGSLGRSDPRGEGRRNSVTPGTLPLQARGLKKGVAPAVSPLPGLQRSGEAWSATCANATSCGNPACYANATRNVTRHKCSRNTPGLHRLVRGRTRTRGPRRIDWCCDQDETLDHSDSLLRDSPARHVRPAWIRRRGRPLALPFACSSAARSSAASKPPSRFSSSTSTADAARLILCSSVRSAGLRPLVPPRPSDSQRSSTRRALASRSGEVEATATSTRRSRCKSADHSARCSAPQESSSA